MKSLFESNFLFTTCQVGAEPTLKKELAREHPELKFAYSRPGFLTFKHPSETIRLDFELKSVFARAYGVSIGGLTQVADLKLPQDLNTKPRLHAWERDITPPGEEPLNFVYGPKAAEIETRFRTIHADAFESSTIPKKGDFVLDVILLEENQPHSFWLGAHLHSPSHSPWPGGRTPLTLPKEAPSRAYLKLEEGLLWSKAPVQRGDTAIEIGSAPGGASYALLKRGLKVVGIDPGQMAPLVLQHPQFEHIQSPVGQVLREDLPESIQWIFLDMNVEPRISLFALDRLASRMQSTLLGGVFTLKLNQWKIAEEIPVFLEHLTAIGFVKIKAAQVSSCRQEILVYGLTRRGLAMRGNRKIVSP